ncbi:hypothetical protein [Pseudomonas sp. C9-3]|uniref:hypothetical protein n=1 Tax=Pseudomonas sp. C9-3 TaxID=3078264 RepID=UPI0028EEDCEF|nr:hypothetical protein [Pseudomonas sp. C9-3]
MLLPTPKEMRPGGALDIFTLKGNIRCFFLGWICFFGMWYAIEIFGGLEYLLGIVSDPPTVGQRKFYRFLAISLAGPIIFGSLLMGVKIFIKQNRAKKSANGQWYDRGNLTREELYGQKESSKD